MQAEFNEESTKLNERIMDLEKECNQYKAVIHKLSNKVCVNSGAPSTPVQVLSYCVCVW
jgi:hypothetical protein